MEVYGLLASGYGDWPIIKQIAWLLGQVMNGIFNVLSKIGIENIERIVYPDKLHLKV